MKILLVYYSMYGHIHQMMQAAAEGAGAVPGAEVVIRRVPETLSPEILEKMGATAAQTLLGRQFRVSRERGRFIQSPLAGYVMATVHPSAILRAPDSETRRAEMARFVEDLKKVARVLGASAAN